MYTAAQVDAMLASWTNLEKPTVVVNLANACIGWPYVFGGRGEYCTPSNRGARVSASYPTIKSKCQVLMKTNAYCNGCQYYPGGCVRFFDCRGFTY